MKVAIVTYGLINRKVALLLRQRGIDVVVFEDSETWANMAREDGMEVVQALVTDRAAVEALKGVEVFVLMDVDALRVDRLERSWRREYPDARVIAPDVGIQEMSYLESYSGDGKPVRIGQDAIAKSVVSAVEDHMSKRSTDHLVEALRAGEGGEVAIFTHDDPDPDAIASGMGMVRICEHLGLRAQLYHGGAMGRLENRFFARLVGAAMATVEPDDVRLVLQRADRVVLLDAGRPGEHNVLPSDTVPNIVLDHHSTNREISAADYCDVRPAVGSTSTMVTSHIQELGITPEPKLAAALLFGIRTDTDHLRRNASIADMRASAYLASLADQELLDLVEHPPLAPEVMDVIGRGILARRRSGEHLLTWCGGVASRDELPPVADLLLQEEDVSSVFVFGRLGDKVIVSARSVTGGPHVGDITKRAIGDIGSGGGHATMAGGSVDIRTGVDLDVDRWVQEDLFAAFMEAAGAG